MECADRQQLLPVILTDMSHALPRPRANHPFLRRGSHTLQIGLDRQSAAVLDGMSDAAIRALVRLDGTVSRGELVTTIPEFEDILNALERLGLIEDAEPHDSPLSRVRSDRLAHERHVLACIHGSGSAADEILAGRARRVVGIRGHDRAAAHIAVGLASAGVGTVGLLGPDHVTSLGDITPVGPFEPDVSWVEQLSEAVRRQGAHATLLESQPPDLVVIAASADVQPAWTDPELAHDLMSDDIPHYPIAVSGGSARIGPMIIPGLTPCLDCLDLRERDRDRAWPALVDQVRLRHHRTRAQDGAVAALGAAIAVREILTFLDDRSERPKAGNTFEYKEFHDSELTPTSVSVIRHPLCGCGWGQLPRTMES